jgi:hypothetical protein
MGLVIGSLIAISFGLVFILLNSGGVAAPWPTVIRVAGVVAAVVLLAGVVRVSRAEVPAGTHDAGVRGFSDWRFRVIALVEFVSIFAGIFLLNTVFHLQATGVAWVAFVVGVHFVALALIWRMPMFTVLGVVMAVLGVLGFVLIVLIDGGMGMLVAGVGSGLALFGAVAAGLRRDAAFGRAAR